METVIAAFIGALPAGLAAIAAYRKGKRVHASVGSKNGAGTLQQQFVRLNAKVDDLDSKVDDSLEWQKSHLNRWHLN